MSILALPNEILYHIAEALPPFDLVFTFSRVSLRFLHIAINTTSRSYQSETNEYRALTDYFNSTRDGIHDSYPYVQSLSPNILCTLSFSEIVFSTIRQSNGCFREKQISWPVTYDTNIMPVPQSKKLLLWTYGQFSIFSFTDGNSFQVRTSFKRVLPGKKTIAFSRSGRYLICCTRTFSQSYGEMYDTRASTNDPLRSWPSGLQSVDFAPDEKSYVFLSSTGEVILSRMEDRQTPSEIIPPLCTGRPLSVKFSSAGDKIFIVTTKGTICVYDVRTTKMAVVQQIWRDQIEQQKGIHTCFAVLESSLADDELLLMAENDCGPGSTHELCIVCPKSGTLLFHMSRLKSSTSSFEFVAFLSSITGVILLINGKLECWIYPDHATEHMRSVKLTATLPDIVHSGRITVMNSNSLLVGVADGSVKLVKMPNIRRMMLHCEENWEVDDEQSLAWINCFIATIRSPIISM